MAPHTETRENEPSLRPRPSPLRGRPRARPRHFLHGSPALEGAGHREAVTAVEAVQASEAAVSHTAEGRCEAVTADDDDEERAGAMARATCPLTTRSLAGSSSGGNARRRSGCESSPTAQLPPSVAVSRLEQQSAGRPRPTASRPRVIPTVFGGTREAAAFHRGAHGGGLGDGRSGRRRQHHVPERPTLRSNTQRPAAAMGGTVAASAVAATDTTARQGAGGAAADAAALFTRRSSGGSGVRSESEACSCSRAAWQHPRVVSRSPCCCMPGCMCRVRPPREPLLSPCPRRAAAPVGRRRRASRRAHAAACCCVHRRTPRWTRSSRAF